MNVEPAFRVCPRCHVPCRGHTDAARQTALLKPGFSMPCSYDPVESLAAAEAAAAKP